MKKLVCFFAMCALIIGSASAQCIGMSPVNITPEVDATSTFTFSFQNAQLDNAGKYAFEYEFYLDGELIPDAEFGNYVDLTASSITNSLKPTLMIGYYLSHSAAYYPVDQFELGGNYSAHEMNYFNGKYLNAAGVKIQMNVKWLQTGNYSIRAYLVEMEGGTADSYMKYSVGKVLMGGNTATYGDRILSAILNVAKQSDPSDTLVCYNAFPFTLGNQTWTSEESWQDGGQSYPYITKSVTFYTPNTNACTAGIDSTAQITVRRLPELSIVLNQSGHNTTICSNSTAGYASVAFSGGVSPYTIQALLNDQPYGTEFTSDQANQNFKVEGLGAGTYSFRVTDAAGCQVVSDPISITNLANDNTFSITTTQTNVVCYGFSTGSISLTGVNYTVGEEAAPYIYAWSGDDDFSASTATITDLKAGTYTLKVTDALGCFATTQVVVSEGDAITNTDQVSACPENLPYNYKGKGTEWTESGTYDVTFESVKGCDSVVTVTFTVLSSPTAVISGDADICTGAETTISIAFTGALPIAAVISGYGDATITEESPFSFNVQPESNSVYRVTSFVDNNGCAAQIEENAVANSGSATVNLLALPVVNSLTLPDANTCPFSGPFDVTADVTAGSSDELTYHWTGAVAGQTANSAVVAEADDNSACGFEYSVSLYVTDANQCASNTANESFTIADQTNPVIDESFPTTAVAQQGDNCVFLVPNFCESISTYVTDNCAVESITQAPTAGTTLEAGSADQDVVVTVTDKCGNSAQTTITVSVPQVLTAQVVSAESFCYGEDDGEIVVAVEGGQAPYTYQLNGETIGSSEEAEYQFTSLVDGQYTIAITDANNCNLLQDLTADVAQIAAPLYVTSNSDYKIYDGEPLSSSGYSVAFENESYEAESGESVTLLNGDVVTANVSGSILDVDTIENDIISLIILRNSEDVTCYYNIVKTNGELGIRKSSELEVVCPAEGDAEKMYDGEAIQPTATANIADGTTINYSTDNQTWSTTAPSLVNAGTMTVYVKAENSNYETATCDYTLNISKRSVLLSSATDQKVYDGAALTNDGVEVSPISDGWIDGEGATYTVTGSQLDAGSSKNNFTYELNQNTLADNYMITLDSGILTVTPIETEIIVTAADAEKYYDGLALTQPDYTYAPHCLIAGDELSVVMSQESTITDAGEQPNTVATITVMRGQQDVTGNYTFGASVDGLLTVLPIEDVVVTITGHRDTVLFDGQEHSVEGYDFASSSTLFTENCFSFNGNASVVATSAGVHPMEMTSADFSTVSSNFINVTYNVTDGQLVIKPADLQVTATGNSKVYDGQASSADVTVSVEDGTTLSFKTNENDDFTADVPSLTNVGVMTVYVKASNPNYNDAYDTCTIEITKRSITLVSANDTKVYDGTALTNDEVTVSPNSSSWADGEGAEYTVTGSQTEVGESENVFTFSTNEGTLSSNYDITTTYGTLSVTAAPGITVNAASGNFKMYDGTELSDAGYVVTFGEEVYPIEAANAAQGATLSTGDVVIATIEGSTTDADTIDNVVATVTITRNGLDMSANYGQIQTEDGTIGVYRRNVILVSADDSKTYDAVPLTNDNVEVAQNSDGWAPNEGATYTVTGSQLVCGSSDNEFTYELNSNTKALNYNISTQQGTLTVEAYSGIVTITAADTTRVYNALPLSCGRFSVTGLQGDETVSVMMTLDSRITDAGETANEIGTHLIMNGNVDVTSCYPNVRRVNGTLTVEPKPVTLLSASATQQYNGDPLRKHEMTTNSGWLENDGVTITFTGEQTLVGSSDNTYTYEAVGTTNLDNYDIQQEFGTLEVTNRDPKWQISLESNSDEVTYDGTSHSVSGFTTLEYTFNNHVYTVSGVSASVTKTSAGTYNNEITGTPVVKDADNNDVTDQFEITNVTGQLVILKGVINLTCPADDDVVKVYDGTPLQPVATATTTPQRNVNISYKVDGGSYSANVPSLTNVGELHVTVKAENANFTTAYCEYTLTVEAAPAITVTANSDSKDYDATPLTNAGYTVVYDNVTYDVLAEDAAQGAELPTGDVVVAVVDGSITNYSENGAVNQVVSVTVMNNNNDQSGNYAAVNTEDGVLTINKLPVTLVSADANQMYDGTPLIKHELTTNEGWFGDEGAVITYTGSQTLPGTSDNTFTYEAAQGTILDNYEIDVTYGTLTVTANDDAIVVTSQGNTWTYDGEAHTNPVYTVTYLGNEVLANGNEFTLPTGDKVVVNTPDPAPSITNYNAEGVDNEFSYSITDAQGVDVANIYTNVTTTTNKLMIAKKAVTLTSADSSKTYDGTPLVQPTVIAEGFVADQGAVYNVTGSVTHVADNADNNNTYTYELKPNTLASNYTITKVLGTLTIEPIENAVVNVTGSHDSLTYDGQAHEVDGYEAVPANALMSSNNIQFAGTAHAERTNAGTTEMNLDMNDFSYENDADFVDVQFNLVADGYITIIPGQLVLTCPALEACTKEYDGTALQPAASVLPTEESTIQYSLNGTDGWETEAPSITHVADGPVTVYVKATNPNYYDATCEYELSLTPKSVTLVSADLSKPYDGDALTNDQNALVTEDGWVDGEGATYTFTGSQTEVGTSDNAFEIAELTGNAVGSDYEITITAGSLTVTAIDGITVTITGNHNTDAITYDGQEHFVEGYTVTSIILDEQEYAGYDVSNIAFDGLASVSATNAGKTMMGLTSDMFSNTNSNFTGVTFVVEDGYVKIDSLEVFIVITGNSDELVFDGEEHQVDGFTASLQYEVVPAYDIANVDLAPNSSASVSRLEAGESTMGLSAEDFVNNDGNYKAYFLVEDGSIIIHPAEITVTIQGASSTVTYDGMEHSVDGYEVVFDEPLYDANYVVFVGTQTAIAGTNVGSYYSEWQDGDFENSNDNFEVTFEINQAELTINAADLTVTINGNRDTVSYDASEHTVSDYTFTTTPVVNDFSAADIQFNGTAEAAGTNVDDYWMYLSADMFASLNDNYDVTFTVNDGMLRVNPQDVAVAITGNNATVDYNGEEQSVHGYTLIATPSDLINLTADIEYSGDSLVAGTEVATYDMELNVADFSCNNDNFNVTFTLAADGYITIQKPQVVVTVTGHTLTTGFDNAEHQISGYDLEANNQLYAANMHNVVTFNGNAADTTAIRTNAGQTDMTMTPEMFDNSDESYDVTFEVTNGYVEILPENGEVNVVVKGHRDTVTYDGLEHHVTGYDLVSDNDLYDVSSLQFNGSSADTAALGTNAETYTMTMDASMFENTDENFANVSVTVEDGYLVVRKAPVTVVVVGHTGSFDYDGQAHTVTGYDVTAISNDLYSATDFELAPNNINDSIAERTDAGETTMLLAATSFSNLNQNFDVTFDVTAGSIEIEPVPVVVTITGNSGEFNYDGQEHTVHGFVATADNDNYDVANDFTFSGTASDTTLVRTEIGESSMTIPQSAFANVNDNFTNVDFVIVQGSIKVNEAMSATTENAQHQTTVEGVSCFGEQDGRAVVTISGGKAPYTYAFTAAPASNTPASGDVEGNELELTDLAAGDYTVTITDAIQYSVNVEFTIETPAQLQYRNGVTAIACNGGLGVDTIQVSGGTAPYTIEWDNNDGVEFAGDTYIVNDIVGSPDSYEFVISDANGCQINGSVSFDEPDEFVAEFTTASVETCQGTNEQVEVEVDGGTGDLTYIWEIDGEVMENLTTASCGIDGFAAGEHSVLVTVKDAAGCAAEADITVKINPVYHIENNVYIASGETYELNGVTYQDGDELPVQNLVSATGCDSIVTGTVLAFGLAIQFTDTCVMTQSTYTRPYNMDPIRGEWRMDTTVRANVNESKMFFAYITNNDGDTQWDSEKVDIYFELYKDGVLVNSFDDCLDSWMISTYYDRTGLYYGMPITEVTGEIPANTFLFQTSPAGAIKAFDYFNFKAFERIPNKIEMTFNQEGVYTLKMKLEKRVGGEPGTNWSGIYNPYIVNRKLGPLFGGRNNVPDEKVTIAARDLTIVVGSAPTDAPTTNNAPAAVADYVQSSVSLFPNPVRDQLNVSVSGMEGETVITIVDAQGKVLETINQNLSGDEALFTHDVKSYAQGLYFVYVRNNGQLLMQKFILVK